MPKFDNQFCLRCPKCKESDKIEIQALVYVRLTPDGTDADISINGDHEWDGSSDANCAGCGYSGVVHDFKTYQCQNCLAIHNFDALRKEIPHYSERVAEDEAVPTGECPDCGALCQLVEDPDELMEDGPGEESDSDKPDEDAITTEDHIRFYQYGKLAFEYREEETSDQVWYAPRRGESGKIDLGDDNTVEHAIQAYMNHEQFWPDAWFISDHGNAHLILNTKEEE